MFISTNQKERDSATAYCTLVLQYNLTGLHVCRCSRHQSSFSVFHSGMTIEVLGTVLGTAIQGQIVGGTNDCPAEFDAAKIRNGSKLTMSTASLEESVSIETTFLAIICRQS